MDRLQQILFFKQLSFSLDKIKAAMDDPAYDAERSLVAHKQALLEKKKEIELLIKTVDATLEEKRGGRKMSDKEKFEGLKKELLDENETRYGQEIREKYGEKTVAASNKQFAGMSEADFDAMQEMAARLQELLTEAMATGDAGGEAALAVAALHKQWLSYTWPSLLSGSASWTGPDVCRRRKVHGILRQSIRQRGRCIFAGCDPQLYG